jgi:tetratricopeptide (TPR) repeat protein
LGARLRLIAMLLLDGEIETASIYAREALALAPESAPTLLLAAEVKLAEGERDLADEFIRRALTLDPNSSIGHCTWGFRKLNSGDFDGARLSLLRSIELQPNQGLAYMGLTQTRKLGPDEQPLLSRMERVLASGRVPANETGSLRFAIAKSYDDLGRCEEAMTAFDDAHDSEYRFRFGSGVFDKAAYSRTIDSIIELLSRERVSASQSVGIDSDLPILVVGMLRSGTTLTAQILSSHSTVGASGENLFWGKFMQRPDGLSELASDPEHLRQAAKEYVKLLQASSPGKVRVIDKLPGNYLRLGLIHLALPNAKIVHCRRSPIDTALSIYTTPNRTAPSFTHSREGIVFTYREYLRLMEHWRGILPASRFFEIRYEELVADPEPEIRRLFEFCELDWEPACLRPELNSKEVATPSLWQVRQPIYRSSVERWRRYEPWLGAFRELLDRQDV